MTLLGLLLAVTAQSPLPTPPVVVTPTPAQPPPSNVGTMALWIGISVLALLSAIAYVVLRRRRAAAEADRLDDAAAG